MKKLPWSLRLIVFLAGLVWMALSVAAAGANAQPLPGATRNQVTFWVVFPERPNLQSSQAMADRTLRGQSVVTRLKNAALLSQAGVRGLLTARRIPFRPFWIANALKVTGDAALMQELAARPDVAKVMPDGVLQIPKPATGQRQAGVQALEWNIERIKAQAAWSGFGSRGEGIVIGSIDTGVEFTHAALVGKYRGHLGNGQFDHNYNWHDPSQVCGIPSLAPCDNAGHGTHTMGTMVGDDGDPGSNQIGVAPHAVWIAAKGCEEWYCSYTALLSAGEWMLAPTDLTGSNPDVSKRPDIINNSWGGGSGDPFYQAIVEAWVASGIFPAFSNGNAGPFCSSAGSPGDYVASYSAGASDFYDGIAAFSSRGPSLFAGEAKPDITAPGVDIRSSMPGNAYGVMSGTSMASPHVAGTVALMWSVAPVLKGDVATTRGLLDKTAIDVADDSCGGLNDPIANLYDNNVWGEGRLDALAAVTAAFANSAHGRLEGVVIDGASGLPLSGVELKISGNIVRTVKTDGNGAYGVDLPPGGYSVLVTRFGYVPVNIQMVTVIDGGTVRQDIAMDQAPRFRIAGTVVDVANAPVSDARVVLLGTPLGEQLTDASGAFRFDGVPEGEYDLQIDAGGCLESGFRHVVLSGGDQTVALTLQRRTDPFGYHCSSGASAYLTATDRLDVYYDWSSALVNLPFAFNFYGQEYTSAHVSTAGTVNFQAEAPWGYNTSVPDPNLPNAALFGFWDELWVDPFHGGVYTATLGSAPDRRFVIEWRNVDLYSDAMMGAQTGLNFEIVLHENGDILMQYQPAATSPAALGASATAGIEDETGSQGLQYAFNQPALRSGLAVTYHKPPLGTVTGQIVDANDGLPISGAIVSVSANGMGVRQTTTDGSGRYRLALRPGDYQLDFGMANYLGQTAPVTVAAGAQITRDVRLSTARANVSANGLELVLAAGTGRSKTLTLSNSGGAPMNWQLAETGGGKIMVESTAGNQRNPAFRANARNTQGFFVGAESRGWSPTAPGNVLASWSTAAMEGAFGVGYTGKLWLSEILRNADICGAACTNREFGTDGTATGTAWIANWAGEWPADMAYDAMHGLVCQLSVGGDNGIHCWNPATGQQMGAITGNLPWTAASQRGLAYRADDDSFYVGGWNEWPGVIYHVKGLSHPDRGAVIGQCSPPDFATSGLAWDPVQKLLWQATNSVSSTIYQLDPSTCDPLAALPHPDPWYNGGGLELNDDGNLWTVSQAGQKAYLIESVVPPSVDVPWLSATPASGTVATGASQALTVTVDATGLAPGVYNAALYLQSNSGRRPLIRVPVSLLVSSYVQGVNAGGKAYTDSSGDAWLADRLYSVGGWGHLMTTSKALSTRSPIAGTVDDALYQTARSGGDEYRYDNLPMGVYQVALKFAEIEGKKPFRRLYDVIVEDGMVLPAHDIAADHGNNTADDHVFYVAVLDGQLRIRFVPRSGFGQPLVSAIRVTHRPDR
jgi:subtilisin family serine protease